jgi:hypothetical protein
VTIIKTPARGIEDHISGIAERAYQKYKRAVLPVYGTRRASPAHIGSCFFMKVGGLRYVLTAAHVVDESAESRLYIPVGRRLEAIGGDFVCTSAPEGIRIRDRYDFAYAVMDDEFFSAATDVVCIDETDVSLNRVSVESHAYMVIGYPRSKNKNPDNARNSLKPKMWHYYATGRAVPKLYERLGVTGSEHISMNYQQHSRTPEGEVVNTIYARGMSGGPLLDLGLQTPRDDPSSRDSFDGCLAGLFIECHENDQVLLSVKLNPVLDAIRAGTIEARIAPDKHK